MNETRIRWRRIDSRSLVRVVHRLQKIKRSRPRGVPALLNFGFQHLDRECRVFLHLEYVVGSPLRGSYQAALLRHQITEVFLNWRKIGFVHGDLSPRNILFSPQTESFYFIDWILDLESYEGTPFYAAPQVFHGLHDFASDSYAIEKVLLQFQA